MKKVEITSRRRILDDFFKVDEVTVSFERFNGSMSPPQRRLVFERGDSVAAIMLDIDRQVLLFTHQFRLPTQASGPGWIVECVAGMIGAGEKPAVALRREIEEELGYEMARLTPIAAFYVSPGGSSERVFLYYAEVRPAYRTMPGGGKPSEGEDIQTIEVPLADLDKIIDGGRIIDAKTLIGLLWLRRRRAAGNTGG